LERGRESTEAWRLVEETKRGRKEEIYILEGKGQARERVALVVIYKGGGFSNGELRPEGGEGLFGREKKENAQKPKDVEIWFSRMGGASERRSYSERSCENRGRGLEAGTASKTQVRRGAENATTKR